MGKTTHSYADTFNACEKALKTIKNFYREDCLNWKGEANDGKKELYTEIISEYIFKNIELFKGIKTFTRNKSYNCHHTGEIIDHPDKNKDEKRIEIEIFNQSRKEGAYDNIGEIVDYEIPLSETSSDSNGEIDLLSYRQEDQTAIVLELKRKDNKKETMLRCVLECYTYMKILDFNKLVDDYKKDYPILSNCKRIIAAPLVFIDSVPYNEYKDLKQKHNRSSLEKLMKALGIKPFFITILEGKYKIFNSNQLFSCN